MDDKIYGFLIKVIQINNKSHYLQRYYELNIFNMTFVEKVNFNNQDDEISYGYKQLSYFTVSLPLNEVKQLNYKPGFKLVLENASTEEGSNFFLLSCKTFKDYKMWIQGFRDFFNKKELKSKNIWNTTFQIKDKRKLKVLTINYYVKTFYDTYSNSMLGDCKQAYTKIDKKNQNNASIIKKKY